MRTKTYAIILAVMLTLGCVSFLSSFVFAKESPVDTMPVLLFLSDVAGLDLDTYEVTGNTSNLQGDPNSPGYYITDGEYSMHYWNMQTETYHHLEAMFQFENTSLTRVEINNVAGTILYSKPYPSNLYDAVTVFMDRYQAFTGDASMQTMKAMLNDVNLSENSTKVAGNLKLEISVHSDRFLLSWLTTYNGVDYGSFSVTFKQGEFYDFGDSRGHFLIGDPQVNISRDEAINLAIKRVESNNKTISEFTIIKDQIIAELKANTRYEYSIYYPCWIIYLPLDKNNPGGSYVIEVMLWADNGEIKSCRELGAGGFNPDLLNDNPTQEQTVAPPSSSTQQASPSVINQNSDLPLPATTIIICAVVLAFAAVSGVIVLKKKGSI
jgi:hypothetical protein